MEAVVSMHVLKKYRLSSAYINARFRTTRRTLLLIPRLVNLKLDRVIEKMYPSMVSAL